MARVRVFLAMLMLAAGSVGLNMLRYPEVGRSLAAVSATTAPPVPAASSEQATTTPRQPIANATSARPETTDAIETPAAARSCEPSPESTNDAPNAATPREAAEVHPHELSPNAASAEAAPPGNPLIESASARTSESPLPEDTRQANAGGQRLETASLSAARESHRAMTPVDLAQKAASDAALGNRPPIYRLPPIDQTVAAVAVPANLLRPDRSMPIGPWPAYPHTAPR